MNSNEYLIPNYEAKNYHISQANSFVRALKDPMTVTESKLLRFIVSQVMRGDPDLYKYSVNVRDLAKALNLNRDHLYEEFRGLGDSLRKKGVYFEKGTYDRDGNKNYRVVQWISSYEYDNGTFTISLSPDMKEFLLDLKEYTDTYISDVILLPTDGSIKFYELLSSWKRKPFTISPEYKSFGVKLKQNEVIFGIDYLKEYFNVKDKYNKTNDFLRRVIDYNVDVMNNTLFFPVKYRPVKNGRKIVALIFTIGRQGD